jgi:Ca-activated chloride channel family protein
MLLVVRERWPDNPLRRLFTKDLLQTQLPDWRQRLKRLRLRRRR